MIRPLMFSSLLAFTGPVQACETALLLLIDTSSSIDAAEYQLQADGTADAILANEISGELVRGNVAVSLYHWSGEGQFAEVLPWTQVRSFLHPPEIARVIRTAPRAYDEGSTATGFALHAAIDAFDGAPRCERKVIDISTDGTLNAGGPVEEPRQRAQQQGIAINGIAIESLGLPITNFLNRRVVTRGGFVMTARSYDAYADTIRAKIFREIAFSMM